jgi:hypothetical protein
MLTAAKRLHHEPPPAAPSLQASETKPTQETSRRRIIPLHYTKGGVLHLEHHLALFFFSLAYRTDF